MHVDHYLLGRLTDTIGHSFASSQQAQTLDQQHLVESDVRTHLMNEEVSAGSSWVILPLFVMVSIYSFLPPDHCYGLNLK